MLSLAQSLVVGRPGKLSGRLRDCLRPARFLQEQRRHTGFLDALSHDDDAMVDQEKRVMGS